MAKYPFEYQNYLKRLVSMDNKEKRTEYTSFIIGEQVVKGALILEKNSTSKDDDFTNVQVYKLNDFESDIPFEGVSITSIEKEFPDKKFSVEERLSKYIMIKDEIPVFGESE